MAPSLVGRRWASLRHWAWFAALAVNVRLCTPASALIDNCACDVVNGRLTGTFTCVGSCLRRPEGNPIVVGFTSLGPGVDCTLFNEKNPQLPAPDCQLVGAREDGVWRVTTSLAEGAPGSTHFWFGQVGNGVSCWALAGLACPENTPAPEPQCVLPIGGTRLPATPDAVADALVLPRDESGFCEFPQNKTVVRGTLRVTADTPLLFGGTSTVEADAIVVDPDGVLAGGPSLRTLTLVGLYGDVDIQGTIDVHPADDVRVTSRTSSVLLTGPFAVSASDRLTLDAPAGDVIVAPPDVGVPASFSLRAGNRIDIAARGAAGNVGIVGAALAAPAVTVSTRANVSSVASSKELRLDGGALITTKSLSSPTRTSAKDIVLDATGRIVVTSGATLDSGRNIRVQTARAGNVLCLSDGAILSATNVSGQIGFVDVRGVRGGAFNDGSTQITGVLRGALVPGPCP
jgi:hypothetical protein